MTDPKRELAEGVVQRLTRAGHRALFAGGAVRDLLLGIPPADYDVATSARPEQVRELFDRCAVAVGAAFGVLLVLPDGKTPIEVATFRKDLGYTDHRRPDAVAYADEREDALRRDFTMNGLFLDPASGEVLDYVGGRGDLEARLVRAIGDPEARFAEDHLRLLRAVRFAARFHFALEERTFAAVRRSAPRIRDVSAERVREELAKMLLRGDAAVALELLRSTGLLAVVLPEVEALRGVAEAGGAVDGWSHLLVMLAGLRAPSLALAFATLLHDIGKPAGPGGEEPALTAGHGARGARRAEPILERLRFSNRDRDRVLWLLAEQERVQEVPGMAPSRWKRLLREPGIEELLELDRLECLASGGSLGAGEECRARLARLGPAGLHPPPLLGGRDLAALGLAPGPAFREILEALEDAQLDGRIASREEALAFARERVAAEQERSR